MSRSDLEKLVSKYPIDESSWNQIRLWVPSRHYVSWVVKRTHKGEDLSKLLEAVVHFHNNKTRLPLDKRDLLRYRTLSSLRKQLDKIGVQSNRQHRKKRARGYYLLDEIGDVKFYLIENYEGARTLSLGTKWCIANEGDFKSHYSRSVIVVAVVKGKRERDRFSKFAILLDDRDPGYPWTSNSLPNWKEIRNYRSPRPRKGSPHRYQIFDELNDPQEEGWEPVPVHSSFEEILDIRSGRRTVVKEVLTKAINQQQKPEKLVETTFAELRKGRSLRHQQFTRLADIVVENELFNVISLFEHPKARARTCREYLWSLVNPENLGPGEAQFLAQTSAMAIPEAVDTVCRVAVGIHRARARRKTPRTTKSGGLLTLILSNRHLTEETKRIVYEFLGRDVLKMKDFELK